MADVFPVGAFGHGRRDEPSKTKHGAYREIDPAGEDDEGHADRQNAVDEALSEQKPEISFGGEGWLLNREGDSQHDQENHRRKTTQQLDGVNPPLRLLDRAGPADRA